MAGLLRAAHAGHSSDRHNSRPGQPPLHLFARARPAQVRDFVHLWPCLYLPFNLCGIFPLWNKEGFRSAHRGHSRCDPAGDARRDELAPPPKPAYLAAWPHNSDKPLAHFAPAPKPQSVCCSFYR